MNIPRDKTPKICEECGKSFSFPQDYSYLMWHKRRFCSRLCKDTNNIGKPCNRPIIKSLEERYWDKVEIKEGCWGWKGATHEWGYGLLGKGRRKEGLIRATHVSWKIHTGKNVPTGLWVLHKCDNPPCTNPKHLFLGTSKDNVLDMWKKGRAVPPPHNIKKIKENN